MKLKKHKLMAQIRTTIEQSKRLLELGISSDTADMTLQEYINPETEDKEVAEIVGYGMDGVAAWSLGALVKLMPDTIILNDRSCCGLSVLNMGVYYHLLTGIDIIQGYEEGNIFENCIGMIKWLVNHGYIQSNLNKND